MGTDEKWNDVSCFQLDEDLMCILEYLQIVQNCACWQHCQKGITVVKARDGHCLYKELSSRLSQIRPDLFDIT